MNSVKTLTTILVIVVIVLGVGIYMSMSGKSFSSMFSSSQTPADTTQQPQQTTGDTSNNTPPAAVKTGTGTTPPVTALANLTAEQKAILTPPANGTADAQKIYSDMVTAKAVATDTVVLSGNCAMSPLVVKVAQGGTINFKNSDANPHTVSFDQKHMTTIPGGETKAIKLDFFTHGGIFGYGCDAISGPVGMMVIAQ